MLGNQPSPSGAPHTRRLRPPRDPLSRHGGRYHRPPRWAATNRDNPEGLRERIQHRTQEALERTQTRREQRQARRSQRAANPNTDPANDEAGWWARMRERRADRQTSRGRARGQNARGPHPQAPKRKEGKQSSVPNTPRVQDALGKTTAQTSRPSPQRGRPEFRPGNNVRESVSRVAPEAPLREQVQAAVAETTRPTRQPGFVLTPLHIGAALLVVGGVMYLVTRNGPSGKTVDHLTANP